MVRQAFEKASEYGVTQFIDYKQVFDTEDRQKLL